VDWLKQAYDGGLRLMIMSALNNETLCKLLPVGTPCDDLTSVNAQIAEAKAMDNVGAYSFYEIVYTAAQARATIAAGRMAVILAVEASDIFNGSDPIGMLLALYNNGVRTLQPMHQFNSALGGVAFHDDVIVAMQTIKNVSSGDLNHLCKTNSGTGSYVHCDAKIGNVNYKGLTAVGKSFIMKMIQLGMPIDIAHMSEKTIADVQTITTGTCNYPVFISHGHVRDLLERGGDFPPGTDYGWKAKNSHEKTVPAWVISYVSNSGGLFGLRTGADYYDFPSYQNSLTAAGLGNAPIPSKGSLQMNGKPDKRGGTEYHFAYAVDYLTRVKHVNVALGSDLNGMIEQMLFDDESLANCPGSSAVATQDCKMAGMAHIGKEDVFMNHKLNATGLQNVSSYDSLRNNSADAYVQMWERATAIAAGNCCNAVTVSQVKPAKAYNGTTAVITIDGTGFTALAAMSAKLRIYQGTAEYPCSGFQMISSTQASCLAPAGLPVGFYDVIVSNHSGYCNQTGARTKAILVTNVKSENPQTAMQRHLQAPRPR
jgi:microsomal dipeptidase-like Zn-dependent dipeptidase